MRNEVVVSAAKALKLLRPDGELKSLDSLNIVDFVAELERRLRLRFPTNALVREAFASLESVSTLVENLTASRG